MGFQHKSISDIFDNSHGVHGKRMYKVIMRASAKLADTAATEALPFSPKLVS
jgi:hypothetical protein